VESHFFSYYLYTVMLMSCLVFLLHNNLLSYHGVTIRLIDDEGCTFLLQFTRNPGDKYLCAFYIICCCWDCVN